MPVPSWAKDEDFVPADSVAYTGSDTAPLVQVGMTAVQVQAFKPRPGSEAAKRTPLGAVTPPPGDVIPAGSALSRAMSRLTSPRHTTTLEDSWEGSSYCSDAPSLIEWISKFNGIIDEIKALAAKGRVSPLLAEAEIAEMKRATLQKGGVWGWWLNADGIGPTGTPDLLDEYRASRRCIRSEWAPIKKAVSVPGMTGCGYPTFESGLAQKWLMAKVASEGPPDELEQRLIKLAPFWGSPGEVVINMLQRSGPGHKWLPLWLGYPDHVELMGRAKGISTFNRHVFNVSSAVTLSLVDGYDPIKYELYKDTSYFHGADALPWVSDLRNRSLWEARLASGQLDARSALAVKASAKLEAVKRHWGGKALLINDDLSGFDQHVSAEHQQGLLAGHYGDPTTGPAFTPAEQVLWKQMNSTPVAGPMFGTRRGQCYLLRRPKGGTTTSGGIDTSGSGSRINIARVFRCVARACGWSLKETERQKMAGGWDFMVQGDDILLFVPPFFDSDKYSSESKATGLPNTAGLVPVFLRLFLDTDTCEGYNMVCRVAPNRVFPEDPTTDEVIGMAAAIESVARNPLYPLFEEAMRGTGPWERWMDRDQFIEMAVKKAKQLGRSPSAETWLKYSAMLEHGVGIHRTRVGAALEEWITANVPEGARIRPFSSADESSAPNSVELARMISSGETSSYAGYMAADMAKISMRADDVHAQRK